MAAEKFLEAIMTLELIRGDRVKIYLVFWINKTCDIAYVEYFSTEDSAFASRIRI